MPVANTPESQSTSILMEDATTTECDILTQIREVTSSPTPLTEFLQDPVVISKLSQHRSRSRSKHPRDRGREGSSSYFRQGRGHNPSSLNGHEQDGSPPPTLMSLILAEEDRQAQHLKAMLRTAGERLEYEIRRANNADSRADFAEMKAKDAVARLMATESALHQEEVDSKRRRDEVKSYQEKAADVERELRRIRDDIRRVERDRDEAKGRAVKMTDEARKWQFELNDLQAREEGKEEGRRLARQKWFEEGREEGWEAGHEEGFEDGRQDGYEEGLRDGKNEGFQRGRRQGRDDERKHALGAFDRFLESEMGDHGGFDREERTRQWAHSYR